MSVFHVGSSRSAIGLIHASLLVAVMSGPAIAGDPEEKYTRSEVVSTKGLDLTSPDGQALLQKRIRLAARRVCNTLDIRNLQDLMDFNSCRASASAEALTQAEALTLQASARAKEVHLADSASLQR